MAQTTTVARGQIPAPQMLTRTVIAAAVLAAAIGLGVVLTGGSQEVAPATGPAQQVSGEFRGSTFSDDYGTRHLAQFQSSQDAWKDDYATRRLQSGG
jgi:hypothetical protein